jgi:hypothetical protein
MRQAHPALEASVASKNRIVAIGLWLPVLAFVAGSLNFREAAQTGPQSAADAQRVEERLETLQKLEVGAAPLFVFGDVNEDGKVNAADLELMKELAAGKSPATATCPAAGDFNQDGRIDATDVDAMRKMLSAESQATLTLGYPYRLPCSFKRLLVAAHPNADEKGENSVYFLDAHFTTVNSTVVVQMGKAAVTPMADHHGYIIDTLTSTGESGTLVVKITLGKNGSGGTFTYSYHFGP